MSGSVVDLEWLAAEMKERGINAADLAKLAGLSRAQAYKVINSEILNPGADTISKIADALGVSTDRVLGRASAPMKWAASHFEVRLIVEAVDRPEAVRKFEAATRDHGGWKTARHCFPAKLLTTEELKTFEVVS